MSRIAVLDDQTSPTPIHRHPALSEHVEPVDVYKLPHADLGAYPGLIAGGMIDQEFLYRHRAVIQAFLAAGKVVVWCGHLLRPWLPGCGLFVPARIRSFRDYAVHLPAPGPVFANVEPRDLTFRNGVAGFFARGQHPPPAGAQILATLAGGQPTTYLDRATTRGVILAHAGTELLGYARADSTAARIPAQLLGWIRSEGPGPQPVPEPGQGAHS